MAAFFNNNCQWQGCGKKCGTLLELINHVESTHIDSDQAALERREQMAASSSNSQSTCTALSYIHRFFSDAAMDGRKHNALLADVGLVSPTTASTPATVAAVTSTATVAAANTAPAPSPKRVKKSAPRRSSSVTAAAVTSQLSKDGDREAKGGKGSAAGVSSGATAPVSGGGGGGLGEADNVDSDDSWTYQDSVTSDEIMKLMNTDDDPDKPFICPVQGCGKRYKNVNGIKYHARNGHKSEKKIRKTHKCKCGKSYKSSSSLRAHQNTHNHDNEAKTPALDSTMLTPTTTSLASSLDSLAAQASSAPKPKAQTTRAPVTATQPSTKLSQTATPKQSNLSVPALKTSSASSSTTGT
eukprot:scpid82979/ scgid17270/ Juxtaposed with another zinc finger protein 1